MIMVLALGMSMPLSMMVWQAARRNRNCEIKDYLLQFGRLHLSVSDTDTAVGNVPLYHGLQLKQIGNTVIHEEYLPVTAHLKIDGVGNDFLVEGVHFRLDGIAG